MVGLPPDLVHKVVLGVVPTTLSVELPIADLAWVEAVLLLDLHAEHRDFLEMLEDHTEPPPIDPPKGKLLAVLYYDLGEGRVLPEEKPPKALGNE